MEYIIKNINSIDKSIINNFNLYADKKNRINKYKNNKNKIASIVGDILLSNLLSKYNLLYDDLSFIINEYGKPYINDNIYFNISHSHEYVITVVSMKEIGVDIEKIRQTPINVINQFATDKEKEYILSSNSNIEERIFKIYTLKEAYFKMIGTDLTNILNIEFIIDGDNVLCSDNTINAGFIHFNKDYIVSFCERK